MRARRYSERRVTAAWRLPDYGLEVDRYSGGAPAAVVETPDPGLGHDPPLCWWLYLWSFGSGAGYIVEYTRPGIVSKRLIFLRGEVAERSKAAVLKISSGHCDFLH